MTWQNPEKEKLREVLESSETIAVVGLSDNPERTSYQVSERMQANGYKIIPVNPTINEALGEKAYATLNDVPQTFDIINVFRRPEHLPDIAKEAAETEARVFWAQLGVVNEEAYHFLKGKDFTVIMDLCIKVVHSSLVK